MRLIIEALLLILAALGQDHSAAAGQIFPLDMAPNSVDDYYSGCRGKMAHLVKTKYLKKEISNSAKFKYYWQNSANIVKFPKDHLTRNQLIAIHVYTGKYIYSQFNEETRYGKNHYKHKTFKWYSLYFLLTEAIQILKKTQNKCYYTYRGNKVEFNKNILNKEVRFGSFTSSSLDRKVTQGFGSTSCFEIYTCESAELTKYSQYPYIKEVLIPPYETFKVTAVRTKKYNKNLWCDTVYTLKSTGKVSYQNCALFKKH
ncbi:NAD(P)(+)--arginine ADP-ribosyltransferase 2-like [Rhinichthys klamathensis goyatoka]|uniref:NAD(P)(+)--arginine ADP-ribosyltransferase 2-like n=1 Tax=Rhinichthys klamathensis goyatoka TaxID=3034132 RepID=UPI0024B590CF|nr:NAD(P)(+)--arginine ADP-ribosyltransferase 2-like [Rhinichthys klamathensis goyatoka]